MPTVAVSRSARSTTVVKFTAWVNTYKVNTAHRHRGVNLLVGDVIPGDRVFSSAEKARAKATETASSTRAELTYLEPRSFEIETPVA